MRTKPCNTCGTERALAAAKVDKTWATTPVNSGQTLFLRHLVSLHATSSRTVAPSLRVLS